MRERAPGLSVRLKLTLSYAAFVVIVGIAVFVVGFLVLRFLPEGNLYSESGSFTPGRGDLVDVFVRYAWYAVLALAIVGLGGGWVVSGLMLRPLHRITDAARAVRDGDLAHRVDLPGPRDELTDLADTFDAMLARIEETLEAQKRFAANASHELRTPHATMRTLLEVARADPGASTSSGCCTVSTSRTSARSVSPSPCWPSPARRARERCHPNPPRWTSSSPPWCPRRGATPRDSIWI